jgi:agmatine deiminase
VRTFVPVTARCAERIASQIGASVGVSAAQYANARRRLPSAVRVVEISSNDAWMRDVGPTFLVNQRGGLRGVDWGFNAWGGLDGGLYFPWDQDAAVAQKVLEQIVLPRRQAHERAALADLVTVGVEDDVEIGRAHV